MEDAKDHLVALLIRFMYAGMQILAKAAFNGGMNTAVFFFYRQLIATLLLVPIAFVIERKRAPALPFNLCFRMFMLALVGITGTTSLFYIALDYTTPTVSSAIANSLPVTTFILAVILRMEKVKLKCLSGIAKMAGVGLCVAGSLTIAFYTRGPHFKPLNHHHILQGAGHQAHPHLHNKWVLGNFIMMISNITLSLWVVLQEPMLKDYPSQLLFTTLQCLFSTIQSFFVALALERNFSRWKLGFDLNLISVAYCGIIVTGVSFFLQSWIIMRRGPVFLTMSVPVTLIITMILSSSLLGEHVGLGSILGGLVMIGGLYSVLWGKGREQQEGEIPTKDSTVVCLEEKEISTTPRGSR